MPNTVQAAEMIESNIADLRELLQGQIDLRLKFMAANEFKQVAVMDIAITQMEEIIAQNELTAKQIRETAE